MQMRQNSEGGFWVYGKGNKDCSKQTFLPRCCKRSYALIRVCYDDDDLIHFYIFVTLYICTFLFIHLYIFETLSNTECCNRGYSCFQAEPTTKMFVVFIHYHLGIYLSLHTFILGDKLSRPFAENVEKTLAFPSKWRIIDTGITSMGRSVHSSRIRVLSCFNCNYPNLFTQGQVILVQQFSCL